MDNNSTFLKIFNNLWLIIVLIPFFGGIGFIFAGWRSNETKWMDEGIIYMIPFILLSLAIFNMYVVYLGLILWVIGIIRAILIYKPYNEKILQKENALEDDQILENNFKLNQFFKKQKNTTIDNITNKEKDFDKINNETIEINSASYEELLKIPSFNRELAEKVIEMRSRGEYIDSINDLNDKLNIDNAQITQINAMIRYDRKKKDKKSRKLDL